MITATDHLTVYLSKGWQVLCLATRDKFPNAQFSPRGAYSATHDLDQIATWPGDCNIGVRCGPASKLVVLDLDSPEAHCKVEASFGEVEKTLNSGTGRGRHHWYTLPDDIGEEISFTPCQDVDVKAGGYVVAPPSIHPSGKQYAFAPDMAFDGELYVEDAPDWLATLIRRRLYDRNRSKKVLVESQEHFALIPEKVVWKAIAVKRWAVSRAVNGGCRHHTMLAMARRLYCNGCTPEQAKGYLVEYAVDVSGIKSRRISTKEVDDAVAWAYGMPPEAPDFDILHELHLALTKGKQ
jgi:hypothetical protein